MIYMRTMSASGENPQITWANEPRAVLIGAGDLIGAGERSALCRLKQDTRFGFQSGTFSPIPKSMPHCRR